MTHRNRRRASCRGYSLVEIVLVIGSVSVVLGLCAGLLHTLLRLDRAGRESLNDASTLARLARQFRQDARATIAVKPGQGRGESIQFEPAEGHTISYRLEDGRLHREEKEGTARRRESYDVGRLGPLAFEADGPFVRLVLFRRPDRPLATARPAVGVEARLGKDRTQTQIAEARK